MKQFNLSDSRFRTSDMFCNTIRESMVRIWHANISCVVKMLLAIARKQEDRYEPKNVEERNEEHASIRFLYNQSRHHVARVRKENYGDIPENALREKIRRKDRIKPEFRERFSFVSRENVTIIKRRCSH